MGNLKIGIPQALLYYEYFPLWKNFLEGLGAEVIISGPQLLVKFVSRSKYFMDM